MAARKRVAQRLGHNPLSTINPALAKRPLHLRELQLRRRRLLNLPRVVQIEDLDAVLGVQVRDAGDRARAADGHRGDEPVALAREREELARVELGAHARDLGDAAAGELDADDVGVLAEAGEHVRVDVEAGGDAREVVDDDGDQGGGGELLEEADDGGLVHGEVEVGGDEDEGVVGACGLGEVGFGDDGARGLTAAAEGDCEVGAAGGDGNFARLLDEGGLFVGGQGDGFAVGASQDDCRLLEMWLHGERAGDEVTYRRGGQT